MFEQNIKAISKCALFSYINEENIGEMIKCLNPKITFYKRNDYIMLAGDRLESIGIMLNGAAIVIKENADGNRIILKKLDIGDTFGEMIVFSKNSHWPATVVATENCSICFLTREKIVGECDLVCPWHSKLIQNMLRIISDRALMLNKKVEYLSIKSMRGKISRFLFEQYQINQKTSFSLPMNRSELADFLNVSRPSMSREMCEMRDEGIINFHKENMEILNLSVLKKYI